jgi:biopolymer transport protein TolR
MMAEDHWEIRSEINVTPLVDVCLVLLIVFMVMTPILTRGPEIDLPKTPHPRRMAPAPNEFPILVLFDRQPRVLLGPDYRPISRERFLTEAAALYAADPQRPITLRADRRLPYREVKQVMQTLRDAGFVNVGLIAEKENSRVGGR